MSFEDARGSTDPDCPRAWVGMKELRDHLGGVTANTVTRYIAAGMPAHQPIKGGRYLFDLAQVDEWIDSRCTTRRPGDAA